MTTCQRDNRQPAFRQVKEDSFAPSTSEVRSSDTERVMESDDVTIEVNEEILKISQRPQICVVKKTLDVSW